MFCRMFGLVALLASLPALAAPTTYEFDTVTALEVHQVQFKISGLLVNSSTPTALAVVDDTGEQYQTTANRCVPLLLTAIEKPGRYTLVLVVEPTSSFRQLVSCALRLKP